MKPVQTSLRIFGIYMIIVPGLGLMTFPYQFFDLFGLSFGDNVWMARTIGLTSFIIGIYYTGMAYFALEQLYKFTILIRYFAFLFLVGLWMAGEADIVVPLFGSVDALGATWTLITMRKS